MQTNNVYMLLASQIALYNRTSVEANNMANASTMGFQERYILIQQKTSRQGFGHEKITFPDDLSTPRNMRPGEITATYQSLDLAILGEGYFKVQTPQGIRYTRAGSFRSIQGVLSTQEGYPVLDDSDTPITMPQNVQELTFDIKGNITTGPDGSGRIAVFDFPSEGSLESVGGNFFRAKVTPVPAVDFRVIQGAVMESNVQAVVKMEELVQIQRNFTGLTETMVSHYKMLESTISTLAKMRV